MKNIINIVNFVRAIEPRSSCSLKEPVFEQMKLMKKLGLTGTFLIQYDVFFDAELMSVIKECAEFCEIGLWMEVVQPQVEDSGGTWRGRYPWDWHNDVGFLLGYEPDFRKKLIDTAMEKFKAVFGYYPKSVGSWHIDAVSLAYLSDKYRIDASCNCRDQVGTDGYTMQGGYYNQAYYPSRKNMFCPANTREEQIDVPVFRMLGSDPIIAYDYQIFPYKNAPRVVPTLEPAGNGAEKKWCDWYFEQVFNGSGLCFQYIQAGQENSFGWEAMKNGVEYQFPIIKRLADEGKAEVITLGDTGRWYKSQYELTPPATYVALDSSNGEDMKNVWYSSRFYRVSVMWQDGKVRIRDMYVFSEGYEEHYLNKRCDTHACEYRNLPIMDGTLYSSPDTPAGIYLSNGNEPAVFESFDYAEKDGKAVLSLEGDGKRTELVLGERDIEIHSENKCLTLRSVYDKERFIGNCDSVDRRFGNGNGKTNITYVSNVETDGTTLSMVFDGYGYSVKAEKGAVLRFFDVESDNGEIALKF